MTGEQLAARTPAEAKRHWMIDRLWSICWFCFGAIAFLIAIASFGAWPAELAGQRLTMLGWLAGGLLSILAFIVWSFSLGGPVGRWEARWGNRRLRAEDDETAALRAYDGGAK
jgi:hypothetical protein